MTVTMQLASCTSTLLGEISNRRFKRKEVAFTYALAMQSSDPTDWRAVNGAIIDRWSFAGLERIKREAHRKIAALKAASAKGAAHV